MENEVREGFYSRPRKELTGVVQVVSGKSRLLVRFQDGFEKYMTSNQLTAVTVENIPVEEEAGVLTIYVIPDYSIYLYKVYYYGVYVVLHFNKGVCVYREEEQVDMDPDIDEEDI